MTAWQVLLSVLLGLAINECSDLSPWCARRLVRWSAHCRYTDSARADARAEELTALIDDRPGKISKLITALGFVAAAVTVSARRAVTRRNAARRERQADIGAYSGPSTVIGLFSAVRRADHGGRRGRESRLAAIMLMSCVPSGAIFGGAMGLFSAHYRSLGMLRVLIAAGMVVPGLIAIWWWRRRAGSRPGACIRLFWEASADLERTTKLIVPAVMSGGSFAMVLASILFLLRNSDMWGEAAAACLMALLLVTRKLRRSKAGRKAVGGTRRLNLSSAGRHLTRGSELRQRSAARCEGRSRRRRPGAADQPCRKVLPR